MSLFSGCGVNRGLGEGEKAAEFVIEVLGFDGGVGVFGAEVAVGGDGKGEDKADEPVAVGHEGEVVGVGDLEVEEIDAHTDGGKDIAEKMAAVDNVHEGTKL